MADFGISLNRRQLADIRKSLNSEDEPLLRGTCLYIAPELISGSLPTNKCVVFSLGIVLWQMLAKAADPYPLSLGVDTILNEVSFWAQLTFRGSQH